MLGEVANQKQQLATTAANQLVIGGLSGMGEVRAERAQAFTEGQYADTKKQSDWERLLQTYDPSTPEGLKSLQTGYTSLFGGEAPDLNAITDQRNYLKTKQQQDVAIGGIGVESAEQGLKDQQQASIMSRIASGYNVDRINQELGTDLTPEEYAQMRTNTDTYFTSKGIDMQEASLYGYDTTDANGNKVHIEGSLEISKGQFELQGNTFEEQKKEMWGWTDPKTGKVYAGKYDLLSDENKRAADAMYGYDTRDSKGEILHVMGTLELQNSADLIAKQGISLQDAQINGAWVNDGKGGKVWAPGSIAINAQKMGLEVSSLYGFTYNADTGEVVTDPEEIARLGDRTVKVDGALVLAQKNYGLNESSFDLQYAEMFGKDREGNQIMGADGNPIKGRAEILSAEDRRAAEQLYGYTDVDGNSHPGTLQIMEDELDIKKQGLTLDEAQFYGYDKTVDGKTVHIDGNLEIESRKMDILEKEYQTQLDNEKGTKLADYFATMSVTAGYDWKSDAQASQLLQDYWETIPGNEGTTVDEDWAQRQYSATTISQSDAALTKLEGEQWYKDLVKSDPKTAEQVKTVAKMAAYLSVTQGATPVYDTEGTVIGLKDSEGNTFYSVGSATETPAKTVTRSVGDVYTDTDGKVYVQGAGNKKTELTYEDGEEWTSNAQRILNAGKENNPYYDQVLEARVQTIMDGTYELGNKISDPTTYNAVMAAANDWTPDLNYDSKGFWRPDERAFKNEPAEGTVFKHDGNLYKAKTSSMVTRGQNTEKFECVDLKTGETITLTIKGKNEGLSISGWPEASTYPEGATFGDIRTTPK
jgi:hypothetical protein